MRVVDRYLVRQFLRVFAVTFTSLLGVYVVADFVTNLSEFMDLRQSSSQFGSTLYQYYLARVPWFFDITAPMIVLLSAVFVVAWLQRHNEMTALMSAGISRWRIVLPLIIVGGVLVVGAVINREFGVPAVRQQLGRDVKDLIRNRAQELTARYDNETEILYDGDSVMLAERRIVKPRLRLPIIWPTYGREIEAETAEYRVATEDHPEGYLLTGVLLESRLGRSQSLQVNDRILVFAPREHGWLQSDQVFVPSDLPVEYLQGGRGRRHYASTAELVQGMRTGSLGMAADVQVKVHSRAVQPFLDMALLFMGLAPAVELQRRHVFAAAAKSILVIAGFSTVVLVSHALGIQTLVNPVLAAWAPLMILLPISVFLSAPLRR